MNSDLQKIFPRITPPAGGRQQLQARLSEKSGHSWKPGLAYAFVAGLMVAVVLLFLQQPGRQQTDPLRPDSPLWDSPQVQTWLQEPQPQQLIVQNEQQQRLPVTLVYQGESVRIYETGDSLSQE